MPRDRDADQRDWRDIRQQGEADLIKHHGYTRREAEKIQREAMEISIRNEEKKRDR